MNIRKLNDKQLDLYIEEACEAMLSALPKHSECEHEFSAAFTEKNEKFLRRYRLRRAAHAWARNAAAVFLVFVLGSGAFLGINGEARADFLAWARSTFENSVIYRYVGEGEAPLPDCELTWIPEGYELTVNDRDENSLTMVYENELNDQIIFSCDRMTENCLMQIGLTGNVIITQMKIDDYDAEMFEDDNGGIALLWLDDNGFIYMINANKLGKMEIIHIFDNVKSAK